MATASPDEVVFLTSVRTPREKACARILIESIRAFGGALSRSPVWLFPANPETVPCTDLASPDVRVIPLTVPDGVKDYPFAHKVFASARAEELATGGTRTLAWVDPNCLIVAPPVLFALGASADAAVRPVHIRNVGLPAGVPLDGFWRRIYEAVGAHDIEATVDSFVDGQRLRAYFNSHAFAVNPAKGLLRRWAGIFASLVRDREFQDASCRDERHQIFLFQAILSALLVTSVETGRLRILPPEYNYPYNLHSVVPADRRPRALNDVVCIAYEDRSLDPAAIDDIEIREPLRSWLSARRGR